MCNNEETALRFVDLLLSQPAGQIVACNIVHCCDEGIVAHEDIVRILRVSLHTFAMDTPKSLTGLLGLLSIEWATHRFHGPQAVTADADAECFARPLHNVIRYDYFIPLLDAGVCSREGLVNTDPFKVAGGPREVARLDALSNAGSSPFLADAKLGYGALWLTPDELAGKKADRIRDLLGLVHHGAGVPLVRVGVSAESVRGLHVHRPTFATAGTHKRFRQRPQRSTPLGCGRAIDLSKHRRQPPDTDVDGAIEVVTEPQPLSALSVSWQCVGRTEWHGEDREPSSKTSRSASAPLEPPDYDGKFVQRLLGDRSLEEMRNALLLLCQAQVAT